MATTNKWTVAVFCLVGGLGCTPNGELGEGSTGGTSAADESTGEPDPEVVTTGTEALDCPAPGSGPTLHSGPIGMHETWTADASPHIVTQLVSVPDGASLTIEPCAELRMQKDVALVFGSDGGAVGSELRAEGEPGRPIRVVRDEAAPWSAIVVHSPSQALLRHVVLAGGGSDRSLASATLVLRGEGVTPTRKLALVEHVEIRDSVGHGLVAERVAGFLPGSTGLTITGSGDAAHPFPARVGEHTLDSLPDGDYLGNEVDELLIVPEGANAATGLQEDATLRARGVPYRVGESSEFPLQVGGGELAMTTLTIEAGVVLRFTPGMALEVEHWGSDFEPATGALVALGTADAPIVFTSADPDPKPGDWRGLWFGNVPADHNRIDHARIEYAGGACGCTGLSCADSDEASVVFARGVPTSAFITNTEISRSAGHGITRGWAGPGPDFTASNSFSGIAGCAQTRPRDLTVGCEVGDDGCG